MAESSIPPTVLTWSRGLASLSPGVILCRGLRDEEWRETHRRCCEFVDRWGIQADAAGWDTLRLFGVGPDTGALRGDYCGVLIPLTRDVTEVNADWIRIGNGRAGRLEPVKMPGMIPIWKTNS